LLSKKLKIELGGFEIKTLRVRPSNGKITEVNLLEKAVKRPVK